MNLVILEDTQHSCKDQNGANPGHWNGGPQPIHRCRPFLPIGYLSRSRPGSIVKVAGSRKHVSDVLWMWN